MAKIFLPNLSYYKHNDYLFKEEIVTTKKRRYMKRTQIKQGPLVPENVEVSEDDVETLHIFSIQKGELRTSSYPVVHYSKAYSVQKDADDFNDYLSRDYFTLRKRKKEGYYTLGTMYDSDYFDVYRVGGRIVTLNGDKNHALAVYNEFLESRAASYNSRQIHALI